VIEKGAVVAGRVLDDSGRPLAGASVVLNRKIVLPERKHAAQFSPGFITRKLMVGMHEGTTYSDGSFLLAAMESGEYSLSVTAAGDFARAQTKLFTLHAGAETTVADIRLEPGARIEGIVLDAQGLPDSAATVNVIPLDEEGEARSASTDDDGRFLIRGLSAGSFKVLVMLRKGSVDLEAIKRNSLGLARTVDLVRGGVERLELRAVR